MSDLGDAYTAERATAIARDNDPDAWFDNLVNEPQPDTQGAAPKDGAAKAETPAGPLPDPMVRWIGAAAPALVGYAQFNNAASSAAGRVAKDVGKGVFLEGVGATVRGASAAVENTFRSADEFATWANENLVDLTIGDKEKALADNPAKWLADRAGDVKGIFAERSTNTGKVVEFTSQFLTSQAIAGKLTKALGIPAGEYKRIIDAFTGGAVGFDPKEPRLSNVIDEAAPNFVTDFLKAREDDPALLGRLKTGLENAGLQAASDGIIKGFKLLKSQFAGQAAGAADDAAKVPAAAAQGDDAAEPAVKLLAANDDFSPKAVSFLKGEIPDSPIKVNLDRFESPDEIKNAIGQLSQMLPEEKVIPMAETLAQAKALGITPEQLTGGMQGGLFDRRQIAAGWMMFRSASGELVGLAEKARATGAPADLARFNAAFQTTFGILQTVKGQSAEIARALQIHNALRKSDPDMVKALQGMLDESGGAMVSLDMAEKVAMLGNPELVGRFVQEASKATTRDQIVYAWSNILLSNPTSHVTNVLDTSVATLMQVPETWFASKFGGDVAAGEATARLYGITQGFKDGLKLAARTLRTGESSYTGPGSRVELLANRPLATSQDLTSGGLTRQAGDYLKMLIPTRVMQAGDELTKTMNYRGEMHALAWRKAVVDQGLEGRAAADYAAKLMDEAPEWLTKAAEAQAIKGTFNEPLTGVAASAMKVVDGANIAGIPVGRVLAPFVRTPTNLMRWTAHHTPAAFLSPKIQSEIAAGGATRDMALGRVATGSVVMASFADLTMNGQVTGAGPKDPEKRAALMRTGWQPYSIKVGEQWVSYGRSGTLGSLIGLAADSTELMTGVYSREKNTIRFDGEPVEDSVAAAVVLPFAQTITSKQYMQTIANLIDAMADPNRKGEAFINKLLSSAVPAGVGALERTIDPEIRRAQDWMDAVKAKIPGLSETLPPKLNLWGEPIVDENGIYNLFLPARVSSVKGTAIDKAILDLKLEIAPPKQVQSFGGTVSQAVELSPEQHNKLIALSGNELKLRLPGADRPAGAKDYLNAIIEGRAGQLSQRWEKGSDDLRELIIRDVMTTYRLAAKQKLMEEDGDLRELVTDRLKSKAKDIQAPRMPALQ